MEQENSERCRAVLKEGEEYFKVNSDLKEERVMLLKAWRDIEA